MTRVENTQSFPTGYLTATIVVLGFVCMQSQKMGISLQTDHTVILAR
jgi:hypothetical protein